MENNSNKKTWIAAFAVLVFIAGMFAGVLISPMIMRKAMPCPAGGPAKMPGGKMDRMPMHGGPGMMPGGPGMGGPGMGKDGMPPKGGGPGMGGEPPKNDAEMGKRMADEAVMRLTNELDLNEKQQKQIRKILTDNEKGFSGLRKEMFEKLTKFRETVDSQIKGVLDKDQKKKFEEFLKDAPMPGRMGQHGDMPPAPRGKR